MTEKKQAHEFTPETQPAPIHRFSTGTVVRQKSTSILMTTRCSCGSEKVHCGWFTNTRFHEALIPGEDLEIIAAPPLAVKED